MYGELTPNCSLSINDKHSIAGLSRFTDNELRCLAITIRHDFDHTVDYYGTA